MQVTASPFSAPPSNQFSPFCAPQWTGNDPSMAQQTPQSLSMQQFSPIPKNFQRIPVMSSEFVPQFSLKPATSSTFESNGAHISLNYSAFLPAESTPAPHFAAPAVNPNHCGAMTFMPGVQMPLPQSAGNPF